MSTDNKTRIRVAVIGGIFAVIVALVTVLAPKFVGSSNGTADTVKENAIEQDTLKSTIEVWGEYQKTLKTKDDLRRSFNKENYPSTDYVIKHNEQTIKELKQLLRGDIYLPLYQHINKHVNLAIEHNQFLGDIANAHQTGISEKENNNYINKGSEINIKLRTLVEDEKVLSQDLQRKFKNSFIVDHAGVGIL